MYQCTVLTQVVLVQRLMDWYVLLTELAKLMDLAVTAYIVFTLKKVSVSMFSVIAKWQPLAMSISLIL